MRINPDIFKQYDIRGIYPNEINEKVARKIGHDFVAFLKLPRKAKIAIGRDLRKSSKPLAESFIKGALEAGADVVDIGLSTSPMLYSGVYLLKADAGAMITASHNPIKYNGIKLLRRSGDPINGKEIKLFMEKTPSLSATAQKGNVRQSDISKKYLEEIVKDFELINKIKISVDPGKGAAKFLTSELIKHLGLPESKNPDIFVSFDYDADRLEIKDKKGKEIRNDIVGVIIAEATVKKGDTVVYDLRCSRAVPEYFRARGITAIPSKVGRYDIIRNMKQRNALFGMELTGHYYFKKMNYDSDPFFSLRKLLESMDKSRQKISETAEFFEKYAHSGVLNFKTKNFEKIVERLKNEYRAGSQNAIDGLTIEFSNWWFNIRPSNTEPLVRMVIEAKNQKLLEEKKKELLKIITAEK
jgi:phosphomannomutase